ncbi:nicotinate-nucleotide adenylyltransferase [Lactobacillus sp. ESL0791]|uniref:nicotinate-nucleotide adenylyltransferase n=1 Tax=Lactobacillus sp. ESL0791 TaxID=2983234 RepID=UPI0023F9625F|nr:nicotinate-nucleotide adenylyltransferase [Lactobacillus sp. ESL0791]MDF7639378.1 nicotinate-nucleotide adenylyltransferase [Lactobacillus sp. ESL0791]
MNDSAEQNLQKKIKKIGILGGTFNPVHFAHLVIAEQARTQLHLDEIWFIPTNIPNLKEKPQIAAEDRLAMLQLALQDNPHFKIKLFELERGGVSYTVDTLAYLHHKFPAKYYWLLGSDQIEQFGDWKDPDQIVRLATLVGIKRGGFSVISSYPVTWLDAPEIKLSSTKIRKMIRADRSVRYLLPDAVISYIKYKKLYQK